VDELLHDLSPQALARAIEENGAEFLVALGRVAGAEERRDEWVHRVIGGSPIDYHNAVVRAELAPDVADEVIVASRARMRAQGVPGTWHVGPAMRPPDLADRLVAHGFAHAGDDIGMAADLLALREDLPVPADLAIERVCDDASLATFVTTLAQGFGEGPREAEWVGEMYRRIGLGDDVPWRHYLGWLDGRPVATSSLFLGAGVAGVYFVFTVPEARGQGLGAALTLAPLREARAMGYRVGVLGSSSLGYSVYRWLGFDEYCRIGIYEWRPAGM
jgi:GNAT superfamily N-acetyltransferase